MPAKASSFRKRSRRPQRRCASPLITLVESEVFATAAARLGKSPDAIKLAVTELGRALGKPWSAEEKTAAAAAWIILAG